MGRHRGKRLPRMSVAGTISMDRRAYRSWGCRMGGSGVFLFNKTQSVDTTLDAMDTGAISTESAGREAGVVDERTTDRPQTQRQEGAHLWAHEPGDFAETRHAHTDRQRGHKNTGRDGDRYRFTFWEQCRGEICLYMKANRYSSSPGREPGRAWQGRRSRG